MTNRNKSKRARSHDRTSGQGTTVSPSAPAPQRPARRGFLESIFSPRVAGATSMPSIRASLARAAVTVAGTPALATGAIAFVAFSWLGALALGFEGPFALFVSALALPPVGTSFDATLSTALFGLRGGFVAILGFVALRAVMQALLVAAIVDVLRSAGLGRWTLVRGLRTLPVTMAVNVAGVGLLTLASLLGPLLGPAFGLLIQMGVLVGGVYVLGFAPVIAATEGRRLSDALSRSVRAARMPGAGNLSLAAVYVVASIAVLVAPGKPGSELGVNPTVAAWVLVLTVNLFHAVVQAALAFRYLSIADEVAEGPPQRGTAPRARGRR